MTHGRGSTYGSVVGGLSLLAVALVLYLSPMANSTPPHHVAQASADLGSPGSDDVPSKHLLHGDTPTSGKPASHTTTTNPKGRQIDRQVVYVPTLVDDGKSPTTTTTVPHTPAVTPAPTNATPTVVVEPKSELVDPSTDYWGVAINGVPQGTPQLNALDTEVGAAPSELTWYQGWDEPYPAQTVQGAWQHGALPMITWESKPTFDTTPAQSDPAYSLGDIIRGNYDSYLQTFAQSVASTGLPVIIRLDQEMNGNWFPWSEGLNGNTSGQFAQMWRHVWNIFQAAGANQYVIWLWAPNRVDNLPHSSPSLSELYPGDQYVDWVGIDAYWRYTSEAPTFAAVFGETMAAVEAVTSKPIYIAETSGIETDPTTGADVGPEKVQFTTSFLAAVESTPQIVGFSWFDNVATTTQDNIAITNDWRVDSDPANLQAFKSGLTAGTYSDGLMPSSGPPATLSVVPAPGG
ncbi:MAG TPA: glycosyl hydrolase [Acidimicrobiales bacterium]|nr:glycosyl hydrolase [Acidimicrobiales bacterium]